MKALVITPAYSPPGYRTTEVMRASGLPWAQLNEHSDLVRARGALISRGLRSGAERLILLDADVVPTPEQLRWLAETPEVTPERGVWGMYPSRSRRNWSIDALDADDAKRCVAVGGLTEIRWGGLGFCAVHRESLRRVEAMLEAEGNGPITEEGGVEWHPFCLPFIEDGSYLPDDRSLCRRLSYSGTRLFASGDLKAGHAVTALLTEPDR